jgi:hypothetical protein
MTRAGRALQRAHGISEAELRAIEHEYEAARLPVYDDRYWRVQVEETPPSEYLDDAAPRGLKELLRLVDPSWLAEQAEKPYRLGDSYREQPLHLVSGVRAGVNADAGGPQRFARMLLVCLDHLARLPELDFFAAATFVPEIAVLGNSLNEVRALGSNAEEKLAQLPRMSDEKVSSTIYEMLVGAACVRRGLGVTMVPEHGAGKAPDFKVSGIGPIPGAIECKRRLGLTRYEIAEARHVERLYAGIRQFFREEAICGSLEVVFRIPVSNVDPAQFAQIAFDLASSGRDESVERPWGGVTFRPLRFYDEIPYTRLYAPDYLERVFGWAQLQDEWDGLLCEVEPPPAVGVSKYRLPRCVKWRSESSEAMIKKARGIASLWADAVKQIPDGDIGFVYIGYPEGSRPAVADARTRHIMKSAEEFWHRWSVRVPVTVISRLYPRALGPGSPDLIESAFPGVAQGQDHWLTKVPVRVFTGFGRR